MFPQYGELRPRRLCVRRRTRSTLPRKGGRAPPQFSAHFYCGQTAPYIKMPLGIKVGLSRGDFVLDGDWGPNPPKYSAHVYYSCDFLRTLQNALPLLVCSSSSSNFSILCIQFLEKFNRTQSVPLCSYAQLYHIAPIAEVGVAN